MEENLKKRYVRNLKGRLRSILLSSVRDSVLIDLKIESRSVRSGFADHIELTAKYKLISGDHLFIPFSGSGIVRFENGEEFGIDAEHRDMEIHSISGGFIINLSNSIRFGRLGQFDRKFVAIKYNLDHEMLDLYHRIKAIIEVFDEFNDQEYLKRVEEILEMFPDFKIHLLSYIVHRDEYGDSYETDDLVRKMEELQGDNTQEIDHATLSIVKDQLSDLENIIRSKFLPEIKTKLIPLGHSHIDLAWLWPISETIEKSHRSFATMTYLMKDNDFTFVQSMAWHYKYIEENFPNLFGEILERVKSGKWIPIGGMMVEPDCNLPSGESLVRQVLYGQLYFMEHFGKMSSVAWLPDSFGFPAQLPQILSKSGFDLFVTTKLSWNDTNMFPYDTFIWESQDGSRILVHSHTNTYNSKTDFDSMMSIVRGNSISSDKVGVVPIIYGYGDGGGGPNQKMLDEIKALQNLLDIFITDTDPLKFWISRLEATKESLPSFKGPLYLEYHRGTYTTHSDIKMHNRLVEGKLFKAEAFFSILGQMSSRKSLRKEWETLLKNQFHDILPGSSIAQVYSESIKELINLETNLDMAMREELKNYRLHKNSFTVFCPYPFITKTWIPLDSNKVAGKIISSQEGKIYQVIFNGKEYGFYASFDKGICLYNYSFIQGTIEKKSNPQLVKEKDETEWEVEWNNKDIVRIKRKDVVFPVPQFRLFNDFPGDFDAWELDHHRISEGTDLIPVNIKAEEVPGFGKTLEVEYFLNPGSMLLRFEFPVNDSFVNLDFTVDWKGNNRLLKMYIPVDGSKLVGEQPYLIDEPPKNGAAFEFPMHRFVGVIQNERTFLLMNRTKYGHSFESGYIGVTLLRSPAYPDPFADRGKNMFSFRYGFMEDSSQNRMMNEGIKFNILPEVFYDRKVDSESSITINGAVLGSIKKAEGSEKQVFRLINHDSHDNEFEIDVPWNCKKVIETDLLERQVNYSYRNLSVKGTTIKGNIKANEIVTLMIEGY